MSDLNVAAEQLGFANDEEAIEALHFGARLKAHGFTQGDLDEMIVRQYLVWDAEMDRFVDGSASPDDVRRVLERSRR